MTVTVADVASWARVPVPEPESDEHAVFSRVLAAVTERAVHAFGFPDPASEQPEDWTAAQDQAVIEVAVEQLVGGRNTNYGVAEFEGGPLVRTNSIDYGLLRRASPQFGFA